MGGEGASEGWSTLMGEDLGDDASERSGPGRRDARTVARLRPEAPLVLEAATPIAAVCRAMAARRTDCCLLTSKVGALAGVVTDTDVTREAAAEGLDLDATPVAAIMTANPTCVRASDDAVDALKTMVARSFRHLPVLSPNGAVSGVLNVHRLLDEAIDKLEAVRDRASAERGDAEVSRAVPRFFSFSLSDARARAR